MDSVLVEWQNESNMQVGIEDGRAMERAAQRPQCMGNLMVFYGHNLVKIGAAVFSNEMKGEILSEKSCTECK